MTTMVFLVLIKFTGLEPRCISRFDANKYARTVYNLGVRYIGGCCGFAPYHIRALSEELTHERQGYLPPASSKHMPWGGALKFSDVPVLQDK